MADVFDDPGPFEIGDVVKVVAVETHQELLGIILTITGPLEMRMHFNGLDETHPTDGKHEGFNIFVRPAQIRRRKPPQTNSSERAFMKMIHKLAAPQKVGEPA